MRSPASGHTAQNLSPEQDRHFHPACSEVLRQELLSDGRNWLLVPGVQHSLV